MGPVIPDKLYFKIGEVSRLAGVAPHVLRYWESEFPMIAPKRANSQRLYRRVDVEMVLTIKALLHEQGYTISGARRFLEGGGKMILPGPPPLDAKECLQRIKSELRELAALLKGQGQGGG